MSYAGLIKPLRTPAGWAPATVLRHGDLRAEAITREHVADDVRGINASLDLIRRTRGGAWPTEPVTEEFDYVDLVWHECEFRERDSFTYAVYAGEEYLGCCYLYPLGRRQSLTEELLEQDVDVSWWVTPEAYAAGRYGELYAALQHWVVGEFPFDRPHFSNREIPGGPPGGRGGHGGGPAPRGRGSAPLRIPSPTRPMDVGWASLTPSELVVIRLIARGMTNRQVAQRLVLSQATVKTHVYHVFQKLGIRNRTELAAVAHTRLPHLMPGRETVPETG